MRNKDDPKIKARRIYDHYRAIELKALSELVESDYYNLALTKHIGQIQHRRAFAGRILDLGII